MELVHPYKWPKMNGFAWGYFILLEGVMSTAFVTMVYMAHLVRSSLQIENTMGPRRLAVVCIANLRNLQWTVVQPYFARRKFEVSCPDSRNRVVLSGRMHQLYIPNNYFIILLFYNNNEKSLSHSDIHCEKSSTNE